MSDSLRKRVVSAAQASGMAVNHFVRDVLRMAVEEIERERSKPDAA
jgi:predicted HicB family RNase H-like nuclease